MMVWKVSWKSYFLEQFIAYEIILTSHVKISCDVPQGSILGSLLFFLCVNGLNKVSDILDSIMVADDTNFLNFHSQLWITKNIWVVQSKEIIFKCYQN